MAGKETFSETERERGGGDVRAHTHSWNKMNERESAWGRDGEVVARES